QTECQTVGASQRFLAEKASGSAEMNVLVEIESAALDTTIITIYTVTLREHGAFEACGGTRRSARVSWSQRKKRARSDALHHALRLPSFLQSDCINRITSRNFRGAVLHAMPEALGANEGRFL